MLVDLSYLALVIVVTGTHGRNPNHPSYGNGHGSYPGQMNLLDNLYTSLDDFRSCISTLEEELSNQQSRLSCTKKRVDESLRVFTEFTETNADQNILLDQMELKLNHISSDLSAIDVTLNKVETTNINNSITVLSNADIITSETGHDVIQQSQFLALQTELQNIRENLFAIDKNCQSMCSLDADAVEHLLEVGKSVQEKKLCCETGTLTLSGDDRRAEVPYQTGFGDRAPNVHYSIVGYNFDLNDFAGRKDFARPNQTSPYPSTIGTYVTALTSPDSVTFAARDLGYGYTALSSVTVSWEACPILPNVHRN